MHVRSESRSSTHEPIRNCVPWLVAASGTKTVPWAAWGPCTATCGGGVRNRYRIAKVVPQFGGLPCAHLHVRHECSAHPCPIHCEFAQWSSWSDCAVTCGGGNRARVRMIAVAARFGGTTCDEVGAASHNGTSIGSMLQEWSTCSTKLCPVDCTVSDWGAWQPAVCPVTCGGAAQNRSRSILHKGDADGVVCPSVLQVRQCSDSACPVSSTLIPY